MKRITALTLVLMLCLGLVACTGEPNAAGKGKTYDVQEYILQTAYHPDYRILQLTDIHLANKDDRARQYRFLDVIIRDADADLIVVTGDLFTFADKRVAKELFSFLDSYGIPWTVTFGNHDEQCYFPINWLTGYLNAFGSNCLFLDLQDDDVCGSANFAINLMEADTVKCQLILMDSNRYNYGEYWGYDYIKPDQIAWYGRLVDATTAQNNGTSVPSLAFFHIPLPEFQTAWDEAAAGQEGILEEGTMGEDCCCPEINTGLFDVMREKGSTKAVIVGHDHINNARMLYQGIYLCYGLTSTDRIYYDDGMMGGHVIVVKDDGSLVFEMQYHDYSEVE